MMRSLQMKPYMLDNEEGQFLQSLGTVASSFFYQPHDTPRGFRVEGPAPARILYTTFPAGSGRFVLEHKLTDPKSEPEAGAA